VARAPLYAAALLLATLVVQSAGAVVKGDERVLVVLATSGSRPYTVADVERTVGQAANYFDNASFGKVKLQIDVTPWLAAFTANPGCGGTTNRSLEGVVAPAKVAAGRAGFDPARYDDVVYAIDTSNGSVTKIKVGKEPHGLAVWPQPGRYSLGHTGNMR